MTTSHYEQLLKKAGCGLRSIEAVTTGRKETSALKAVSEWWDTDATFLLLVGPTGTGKTVAATEALRLGLTSETTHFIPKASFVRAVEMSQWPAFGPEAQANLRHLREIKLLAIDDLGSEVTTDFIRQALFDVIDARYANKLRTVLTTNLPPTAPSGQLSFASVFGERIVRRIKSAGVVSVIKESVQGGNNGTE